MSDAYEKNQIIENYKDRVRISIIKAVVQSALENTRDSAVQMLLLDINSKIDLWERAFWSEKDERE